jgi:hypothetical protein
MLEFLTKNQQKIAIIVGYVLVFILAFGLGQIVAIRPAPPQITIEEPNGGLQTNFNLPIDKMQSQSAQTSPPSKGSQSYSVGFAPVNGSCNGKIKGSASRIYHVFGGAFYDKTTKPVWCFNTEDEAKSAGFRKSAR